MAFFVPVCSGSGDQGKYLKSNTVALRLSSLKQITLIFLLCFRYFTYHRIINVYYLVWTNKDICSNNDKKEILLHFLHLPKTTLIHVSCKQIWVCFPNRRVKIRRALGQQNCMPALTINTWRALRAHRFWGDSNTISEKRKSGPLKYCEGPQKYNNRGPNDPWQLLLTLNPVFKS